MYPLAEKPAILLVFRTTDAHIRKPFYCPICGSIVFEYFDELRAIIPGEPETNVSGSTKVIQCKGHVKQYAKDEWGNWGPIMRRSPEGLLTPKLTSCKAQFYV